MSIPDVLCIGHIQFSRPGGAINVRTQIRIIDPAVSYESKADTERNPMVVLKRLSPLFGTFDSRPGQVQATYTHQFFDRTAVFGSKSRLRRKVLVMACGRLIARTAAARRSCGT
jgi:hypothetical protein